MIDVLIQLALAKDRLYRYSSRLLAWLRITNNASMVNHPRPKAGVFAVRQSKPLFENLQRVLLGQSLKPYKPQKEYLSLIGTGDGRAIATKSIFTLPPHKLLWCWKDWIDRRFMKQFGDGLGMRKNN